jgi:hypothetical protein
MLNDQSPEAHNFLEKHVYVNANPLIQYLLESTKEPFGEEWYEELFCHYDTSSNSEPELYHETQLYEDYNPSLEGDYCPEDFEPELREPYEFYIVSNYFAEQLKAHNALLTNQFGFWIWGRETTGQSIILDYIFQKIWQQFKERNA